MPILGARASALPEVQGQGFFELLDQVYRSGQPFTGRAALLSPFDRLMGRWTLDTSPAYVAMDLMARVVSPYDLNPLGLNPLRSVLDECIDFERLAGAPIKLFVTATPQVRAGRRRRSPRRS